MGIGLRLPRSLRFLQHALQHHLLNPKIVSGRTLILAGTNKRKNVAALGQLEYAQSAILRDINFRQIVVKNLWPRKRNFRSCRLSGIEIRRLAIEQRELVT